MTPQVQRVVAAEAVLKERGGTFAQALGLDGWSSRPRQMAKGINTEVRSAWAALDSACVDLDGLTLKTATSQMQQSRLLKLMQGREAYFEHVTSLLDAALESGGNVFGYPPQVREAAQAITDRDPAMPDFDDALSTLREKYQLTEDAITPPANSVSSSGTKKKPSACRAPTSAVHFSQRSDEPMGDASGGAKMDTGIRIPPK